MTSNHLGYFRVKLCVIFLVIAQFFVINQYRLEASFANPFSIKKKSTVCLNMIVKNEKEVITRCLESVLPIIDYWVIVDTGSTDGTQDIIRNFMKEHHVPGELHEHEWVNFGHNREQALLMGRFKADYLLFMDADDILHFDDNFKLPPLTMDCYLIKSIAGNTSYYITRIVKTDKDWHWHGVLHEYVHSEKAKEGAVLQGVKYIYICDGARSKDPEKALKDVKILLDGIEKEPNNARYMFYLAQSYVTARDFANGIKYYNKRIEMGGWEEEVFWSMLQVAHLQSVLGYGPQEVEETFIRALKYRPSRPEPYFYLVHMARLDGKYQKGYELGKSALKLPKNKDILFLEAKTYDALKLEFAICAWWLEKYKESLAVCNALLKNPNLPEDLKVHVMRCRDESLEKLNQGDILKQVDQVFSDEKNEQLKAA